MNLNPIDPDNPVHLEQLARACQLAPYLRFITLQTIAIAAGEPPIRPDRQLGGLIQQMWIDTDPGTRARFVEDALGAIRAASFDADVERVSRTWGTLPAGSKVAGFIEPKGAA